MLKEQGKRLQLRFNIPNIPENKRNVERMLKQSLKAFKLFQHRFNFASTHFNTAERGWQTLSTLPFNKIERMLKQMLKPFARALRIAIDGNRDFPINELGDISHLRHLYIAVTCCNTERERLTSCVLGNHRWHVCWCANLLLSIKWVKNKKAYQFCHCAFSMLYQ